MHRLAGFLCCSRVVNLMNDKIVTYTYYFPSSAGNNNSSQWLLTVLFHFDVLIKFPALENFLLRCGFRVEIVQHLVTDGFVRYIRYDTPRRFRHVAAHTVTRLSTSFRIMTFDCLTSKANQFVEYNDDPGAAVGY